MNETNFTYKLPDDITFFKHLIQSLQQSHTFLDNELAEILNGARGSLHPTENFTKENWNECHCGLQIIADYGHYLEYLKKEDVYKNRLEEFSNKLIPFDSGYLISVRVTPSSETTPIVSVKVSDIIKTAENPIFNRIIHDLQKKGKDMGELYLSIYYIENSLRHFIDEIFKENYGENYSLITYISKSTRKEIDERRKKEERNKWLDERGASDLSYLDFSDIITIINKNWSLFELYFPDQNWLKVKLDELGQIRNLVAHNSYKQIMKQIEQGNELNKKMMN